MNNVIPVIGLRNKKTNFIHNVLLNLNKKYAISSKFPDNLEWGAEYLFFNPNNKSLFVDKECRIKFYCLFCYFGDDLIGFESFTFQYAADKNIILYPKHDTSFRNPIIK